MDSLVKMDGVKSRDCGVLVGSGSLVDLLLKSCLSLERFLGSRLLL